MPTQCRPELREHQVRLCVYPPARPPSWSWPMSDGGSRCCVIPLVRQQTVPLKGSLAWVMEITSFPVCDATMNSVSPRSLPRNNSYVRTMLLFLVPTSLKTRGICARTPDRRPGDDRRTLVTKCGGGWMRTVCSEQKRFQGSQMHAKCGKHVPSPHHTWSMLVVPLFPAGRSAPNRILTLLQDPSRRVA